MAVVPALGYVVFLVVPYLVNDLGRFPLVDVAGGYHDPKALWPRESTLLSPIFAVGGLLTMTIGPIVCLVGGAQSLWRLSSSWQILGSGRRAALALACACLAATIALLASPFGGALHSWWLD